MFRETISIKHETYGSELAADSVMMHTMPNPISVKLAPLIRLQRD